MSCKSSKVKRNNTLVELYTKEWSKDRISNNRSSAGSNKGSVYVARHHHRDNNNNSNPSYQCKNNIQATQDEGG